MGGFQLQNARTFYILSILVILDSERRDEAYLFPMMFFFLYSLLLTTLYVHIK